MKRYTRRTKIGARTLFFTASWCPPCVAVKKALAADTKLAHATSERLLVVDIDTPLGHELEVAHGIKAVPTFVRPDGARLVGGQSVRDLAAWMNEQAGGTGIGGAWVPSSKKGRKP